MVGSESVSVAFGIRLFPNHELGFHPQTLSPDDAVHALNPQRSKVARSESEKSSHRIAARSKFAKSKIVIGQINRVVINHVFVFEMQNRQEARKEKQAKKRRNKKIKRRDRKSSSQNDEEEGEENIIQEDQSNSFIEIKSLCYGHEY